MSSYVGREKGGVQTVLKNICPSVRVLNVHKAESLPLIFQDEEHVHKMCSFGRGPLSLSVYLCRH